jgi:hypothetical protein
MWKIRGPHYCSVSTLSGRFPLLTIILVTTLWLLSTFTSVGRGQEVHHIPYLVALDFIRKRKIHFAEQSTATTLWPGTYNQAAVLVTALKMETARFSKYQQISPPCNMGPLSRNENKVNLLQSFQNMFVTSVTEGTSCLITYTSDMPLNTFHCEDSAEWQLAYH